ncbi:MAG: cell division protein FtsQ/DivIB [Candidatus Omnitrophica bacterium]|nr:cell division protein FtsQ/DivIB [Candidatus Omnitrophota bacterium]
MKRQKKFKKSKPFPMLSGLKAAMLEKSAPLAVLVIFVLVIFILARAFLTRSDYFRLRTVEAKSPASETGMMPSIKYDQLLNLYKGRNIFTINLKSIVRFFEDAYPDAKEIRAYIVLPDKIVVSLRCRWPAAFLKGERAYIIDDEGYILSGMYTSSLKNLPVIEGISTRQGERVGRKFTSGNLKTALELLKEIKKAKFLTKYGVARISAQDPKNLSFFLAGGIEVRIGSENFKDRLKVLEKTIKDPRMVLDRIDYIDVRFEDAVIGPK